jgi:hypothetical protein
MIEISSSARSVLVAMAMPINSSAVAASWGMPYQVIRSQSSKKAEYQANERMLALQIRAAWMRTMGFTPQEIAEACADDGSQVQIIEEQEHLVYAKLVLEITPSRVILESWAIKS